MAIRKKKDFTKKVEFKISAASLAKHAAAKNPNPITGFGADPDFLPANLRHELTLIAATSRLNYAHQQGLVTLANHLAQMPAGSNAAIGPQLAAIRGVATAAHKFLNTLNALSEPTISALSLHSREACIQRPCPLPIEVAERLLSTEAPNLLDEVWEWVSALEAAAKYTVKELKPSKQGKPSEALARGLVAQLAIWHIRVVGVEPPKNNASWFARFARTLGESMGLHFADKNMRKVKGKPFIGPGIVRTGIELATLRIPEWAEQGEALKARERVRAGAMARLQSTEWVRDDEATLGVLACTGEGLHITAEAVAAWTDDQVREVEAYCLALHALAIATDGPRVKVPPRPAVMKPAPNAPAG